MSIVRRFLVMALATALTAASVHAQANLTPLWTIKMEENTLQDIAFSPDESLIALVGADGTGNPSGSDISLLNATDGSRVRTLSGHESLIYRVVFSPDGKTLASGSDDESIRLWDVATGEQTLNFDARGAVNELAFNPKGDTLAYFTADSPRGLWLLDPTTGQSTSLARTNVPGTGIAFSADGTTLLVSEEDTDQAIVQLWDVAGAKMTQEIQQPGQSLGVWFDVDGKPMAAITSMETNETAVWDVGANAPIYTLPATKDYDGDSASVTGIAVNPIATLLTTIPYGADPQLWDAATGAPVMTLMRDEQPPRDASPLAVAVSSDGTRVVVSYDASVVTLYASAPA